MANNEDVNLVIKAQNQTKKVFDDVAKQATSLESRLASLQKQRSELAKSLPKNARTYADSSEGKAAQKADEKAATAAAKRIKALDLEIAQTRAKLADERIRRELQADKEQNARRIASFRARIQQMQQEQNAEQELADTRRRADIAAAERQKAAADRQLDRTHRQQIAESKLNDARRIRDTRIAAIEQNGPRVIGSPSPRLPPVNPANPRVPGASPKEVQLQRTALDLAQRMRGQILAMTSAYVGLYAAVNQVTRAIQEQRSLQASAIKLGAALQTTDTGKIGSEMQFVRDEAERLGLQFVDLASSYSKFAASAASSGTSMETVRRVFSNIAEVSTVLNLSTDETAATFKALEQIFSKGTVQMEELKGQLGDHLPGALAAMAKSLGKTTAELTKMIEQGQLTSDAVVGMSDTMKATFHGQLETSLKGVNAQFNLLVNSASEARQAFSGGLQGGLVEAMGELRETLKDPEIQASLKQLGELSGEVLVVIAKNAPLAAAALSTLFTVITVGMSAGPILQGFKILNGIGTGLLAIGTAGPVAAEGAVVAAGGLTALQASVARIAASGGATVAILAAVGYGSYLLTTEIMELVTHRRRDEEAAARQEEQNRRSAAAAEREKVAQAKLTEQLKYQIATREGLITKVGEFMQAADEFIATSTIDPDSIEGKVAAIAKKTEKNVKALGDQIDQFKRQRDALKNDESFGSQQTNPKEFEENLKQRAALDRKIAEGEDKQRQVQIAGQKATAREEAQLREQEAEKQARAAETAQNEVDSAIKKQQQDIKELADLETSLVQQRAQSTHELADEIELLNRKYAEQRAEIEQNNTASAEQKEQLLAMAAANHELELAETKRANAEYKKQQLDKQGADLQKQIDELTALRDANIAAINARRDAGLETESSAQEKIQAEYMATEGAIGSALDKAIEFYTALGQGGDLAAAAVAVNLQSVKDNLSSLGDLAAAKGREIRDNFAGGLGDAFAEIATGAKTAQEAMQDFFTSFLADLAKMATQKAIISILDSVGETGKGGFFGALGGLLSNHTGGIVGGNGSATRGGVSTAAFIGAPYHHQGGMVGLKPKEQAIIAEKGEEVLTRNDPRHILNGGANSKSPTINLPATVVQVLLNPDMLVAQAMDRGSPVVVRSTQKMMQKNATAFRSTK